MKKMIMLLMLAGITYQSKAQSWIDYTRTPAPANKEEAIQSGKILSAVPVGPYKGMPVTEEIAVQSDAQIPHKHVYMHGTNPETNSYEQDLAILNRRYEATEQQAASQVNMRGTNPAVNSYEQDLAILNLPYEIKEMQAEEQVNMRGTNPKVNSYKQDLAILNEYDKMRGKR